MSETAVAALPEVTIVIRTFNEERHLGPLLDALEQQSWQDFETVVVDSGSTDLTTRIAAERADRLIEIDSSDFTFGYSLNAGIRDSRAPFVAIISAHAIPMTPDWLARLIAPLRASDVAMTYGCQRGVTQSKYSEIQDFLRSFGSHAVDMRSGHLFANNANSAVRRDKWLEHPFDEHLPGLEDIEWARYWIGRGCRVVYEPEAGIYHIHEETWRQVRHRYFREAVAAARLGTRGSRHVVMDVGAEVGRLAADLARATSEGVLARRAGEIVRFRFEKTVGHVGGLLSRADFENVDVRQRELFDRFQRAVVVRGAGEARMEEVPIPECKPGEVLIKVAYAGMCGTDLEIIDGTLGYFKSGLSTYPITPGHEFSGRVVAAGARAGDWKAGDPVVVECIQSCGRCEACLADNTIGCAERSEVGVMRRNGGFAEYVVSPGRFLHRLPNETPLRAAALCEPTAVVLKGLRRLTPYLGIVSPERPCGIIGGGPIGYLAGAILERSGYPVVVFDANASRRAMYRRAESTFDRLAEMGAVIEATGDAVALDQALRRCAAGVPLLLLGFPYGKREFNFENIVAFDKLVIGSVGSTAQDFSRAVDLIGDLPLQPLLTRTIPIADFATAVDEARRRQHLKVMLEVDPLLDDYDGIGGRLGTSHSLAGAGD